jgi:hypothetical protein
MEHQNDPELHELLREWKVDGAPAGLESRVLPNRHVWWHVLIHGYIKIPVPLACTLAILLMLGAWRLTVHASAVCRAEGIVPAAVSKAPAHAACALNSNC